MQNKSNILGLFSPGKQQVAEAKVLTCWYPQRRVEHCQFMDTDSVGFNNDVIRSVRSCLQIEYDHCRRRRDYQIIESTHDPSHNLVEYRVLPH